MWKVSWFRRTSPPIKRDKRIFPVLSYSSGLIGTHFSCTVTAFKPEAVAVAVTARVWLEKEYKHQLCRKRRPYHFSLTCSGRLQPRQAYRIPWLARLLPNIRASHNANQPAVPSHPLPAWSIHTFRTLLPPYATVKTYEEQPKYDIQHLRIVKKQD